MQMDSKRDNRSIVHHLNLDPVYSNYVGPNAKLKIVHIQSFSDVINLSSPDTPEHMQLVAAGR